MKSLLLYLSLLLTPALINTGYDSFLSYDDIYVKLTGLLNGPYGSFVRSIQVTRSDSATNTTGNRPLTVLKVTDPSSPIPEALKGKVLVTAQHHAAGMTGAAMACYLLDSLLDRTDLTMTELLTGKVIYVLPVVNPDSYVKLDKAAPYAAKYMKNRDLGSVACTPPAEAGVNLDRNYDAGFYASTEPCSVNYPGQTAFSEVETKYVQSLMTSNKIDLVIDYDVGGDVYLFPPAGTGAALGTNDAAFVQSFKGSLEFAKTYASSSTYAQTDGVQANGTLVDWAYSVNKAFSVQARIGDAAVPSTGLLAVLQ